MVNIAVLGYGTVGRGTVDLIDENRKLIAEKIGEDIQVKYIVDLRDFAGDRNEKKLTKDYDDVLNDKDVSIVCEMIGGSHPAFEFTMKAFAVGKSVVTSNKEVVSKFGVELLAEAKKNGVSYLFEASVGGGIPIIRPLNNCLAANKIERIDAIVNGTTNYILTQMFEEGVSFADALTKAQQKGYAEANPSADVDGIDAARKIAILAAISWGELLSPDHVYTCGIRDITGEDVAAAEKMGCTIKLIAHASKGEDGKLNIFVSPCMVRNDNILSTVRDVFNGVAVSGNFVGDTFFYGRGAGSDPTASAVCGDVVDAARNGRAKDRSNWTAMDPAVVRPYEDIESVFCVIGKKGIPSFTEKTTLRALADGGYSRIFRLI